MRSLTVTTALWACCLLECIAIGALVVAVASRAPSNHIGFDPRWLGVAALPAILAIGTAIARRTSGTAVLICTLTTVILVVGLLLIDQLNVMVQYDEWLRRGMPPSPLQ